MNQKLVIVGGGPGGMAAALSAYENGIKDITILEREHQLGGILNQCIHDGFGLVQFGAMISGPEYAARYVRMLEDTSVKVETDTMVTDISPDKIVTAVIAMVCSSTSLEPSFWPPGAGSGRGGRSRFREQGRQACLPLAWSRT